MASRRYPAIRAQSPAFSMRNLAMLYRKHAPPSRLTRREMVERSLTAAAGLLLSDRLAGSGLTQQARGRRVLVVGAGLSGLAAAYQLSRARYDVTVVEASNRVGGRVLSLSDLVPGKIVEAGGELIGSNQPSWQGYARQFKLEFVDIAEEDAIYPIVLGGKRLTDAQSEALWVEMETALNTMVDAARAVEADEPWKAADAGTLDRRTLAAWIDALKTSPLGKAALRAFMTADIGVVTEAQSYLGHLAAVKGGGLENYWTESQVYRCRGGNQQLASRLVNAIGAARVLTRTPVRAIAMTGSGARVTVAEGKVLSADHVVLTAPPTVWERITFDPVLPPDLRPQMGMSVKFLMAVRSPFWRRSELAPEMLSDGPVSMTWHATEADKGGEEVMTALSGGPPADICRSWSPAQRTDNYLTELQKVYAGVRANFVRARFMDWPGDPWVRGAFSFPAPGQVTAQGPIFHQGRGRLHFAGEYCSYAFMSTMEGALSSGAAAARRIAAADGVVASHVA